VAKSKPGQAVTVATVPVAAPPTVEVIKGEKREQQVIR
jgi:hypothetical protein